MGRLEAVSPRVSVLLPVHNGMPHLRHAVESVLNQSFGDFELILMNDGSTDGTTDYLSLLRDQRVRIYAHERQGLAASLNRAISLATGTYLARQDHDDVSLPERIARQVAFLDQNPACGMVGTWASIWEEDRETNRVHRHPLESHILKYDLLFNNPFVHSSILIRKSVLDKVGLYSTDPARQPPEDYELWSRMARQFEINNIGEILLIYREVEQSISRQQRARLLDRIVTISAENLAWWLDRNSVSRELIDVSALVNGAFHRVSPNPHLRNLLSIPLLAAENVRVRLRAPRSKLNLKGFKTTLAILKNYYRYRRSARRAARPVATGPEQKSG